MQAATLFQVPDGEQPENWFLWVAALTQGYHERSADLYIYLNSKLRFFVDSRINNAVVRENEDTPVDLPGINPVEEFKAHMYHQGVLYGRERLSAIIGAIVVSHEVSVDVAFNRLLHAQWPIARTEDYERYQMAIQSFFQGRMKTLVPA